MKSFIGTKSIMATAMLLGSFCSLMGNEVKPDQDPQREGHLVEYPLVGENDKSNHADYEGYISWSPKEAFELSYRLNGKLTFGDAIMKVKEGKRICRAGWNGKGMWIFQQVPAEIPADVIPKMQSLPDSAKEAFGERGTPLVYNNQLALVTPTGDINGWSPSVADALAEDWEFLE